MDHDKLVSAVSKSEIIHHCNNCCHWQTLDGLPRTQGVCSRNLFEIFPEIFRPILTLAHDNCKHHLWVGIIWQE